MKRFNTTKSIQQYRNELSGSVGFVPTMGNLHLGHLKLIEESLKKSDHSVVSIFVNPTQFGPNEDLDKYPRTLEEDIKKLESLERDFQKEIILFCPRETKEIYPEGFELEISAPKLSQDLEGEKRPGHLQGVSTVVYRLFHIIRPDFAFFGQKDYQQFLVVKALARGLELATKVIRIPIIRDKDGLALSSRNQYLSSLQRKEALKLPQTLKTLKETLLNKGVQACQQEIDAELASNENWDYLELRNAENLEKISMQKQTKQKSFVILAVYKLGPTRLLDNIIVES